MMNPSQICKMRPMPMEGYLYCQEKCKSVQWGFGRESLRHDLLLQYLIFYPPNRGFGGVMGQILLQVSQGGEGACHGALRAEACD